MSEIADVLVVGAGTAGICVAIEAARRGLRVEVVEATDDVGGTLSVSAGHMSAAGTRLQASFGIDDHPDLHYADVMRIGGGQGDPRLVRLAVDQAPDLVDWLDEQGFAFSPDVPAIYRGHSPYSRPRTYWGAQHGKSILLVLRRLLDAQVAEGRVRIRFGTRMTRITTHAGRVSGISAAGREPVEIAAGVTVLASGGYGSNSALFAEFTPSAPRLVTNAIPTAMGDGIVAARAVGGVVRFGEHHTPRLGLLESQASPGRVDFWNAMLDLTPGTREVREIWVNSDGQRFVAEDSSDVTFLEHNVLRQEGAQFWMVLDSAGLKSAGSPVRQWDTERFAAEAARGDFVWTADDLQTLATRSGIDPAGLESSVRSYNASDRSMADDFGRTSIGPPLDQPPFYAIRTPAAVLCSFGGLDVDDRFQLLRADGTVIPGVHAVGELLGMGATSGAAFCGGMSVTPALAFGRLLGQRLGGAAR